METINIPSSATHTHTIVFLHGRGDTAPTFIESLKFWRDSNGRTLQEIFPSFRWVFPKAHITPCVSFPDTKVSQWFDIWNVRDFSQREEFQAEGLRKSVPEILKILEKEAAALGGKWDHLILAGISQGAATSVHTFLNLNIPAAVDQRTRRRLAAFLGFCCRMPFPGRSLEETRRILGLEGAFYTADNEIIRNTPVLLEHSADDPLVLLENGRGLRDTLLGFGAQVTWKQYRDGGHWFKSPEGVHDVVEFLRSHVSDLPSSQ